MKASIHSYKDFFFRDNLVPKYKCLQVSFTTESTDLSPCETLLSFMFLVRVIYVVVWCIFNKDGAWTTAVKQEACSPIVCFHMTSLKFKLQNY